MRDLRNSIRCLDTLDGTKGLYKGLWHWDDWGRGFRGPGAVVANSNYHARDFYEATGSSEACCNFEFGMLNFELVEGKVINSYSNSQFEIAH